MEKGERPELSKMLRKPMEYARHNKLLLPLSEITNRGCFKGKL